MLTTSLNYSKSMKLSVLLPAMVGTVLLAQASPASAEFLENVDYQRYTVATPAGLSLLQALNRATPISERGRKFHGYTKWNLRWNYRYKTNSQGLCQIASATVTHSVVITLPVLEAGSRYAERFSRYIDALQVHEIGHMTISQEAGHKLERALLNLPAMAGCAQLEQRANQTGYDYVELARQQGRDYDERTRHGATQGASLLND